MIKGYAFAGTQNVWIVVHGELLHTTDRGLHWVKQYGPNVSHVAFADKDHGWIAADGVIMGTENGGETWQVQFSSATSGPTPAGETAGTAVTGASSYVTNASEINSLSFVSPLHGWASAGEVLLTTTDGGKHWAPLNPNKSTAQVQFTDEQHGWGFGGGGAEDPLLNHTTDGGQTWQTWQGRPGCNWYKSGAYIAFSGADTAWAVCVPTPGEQYQDPMYLHKSTDGGQHWFVVYSTDPGKGVGIESPKGLASLGGLFFLDDNRGWVAAIVQERDYAWQTIVRSTQDGGRSWEDLARVDGGMYDLRFGSVTVGYALAGQSSILLGTSDGGKTWTRLYGAP
jgi:photosystem II stability/assembly factor-like uncharacterized protein